MPSALPPLLLRLYHLIIGLMATLAAALIALVTIGIGAEAIMRSLNLGLIHGIVDFAEHAMFCIAILPAPWILAQNGHIGVNLLTSSLPAIIARAVETVTDLVCLTVCGIITFYGIGILIQSYQRAELIFQELIIPEWWLQWQVPLAFALLSVEFALRLARGGRPSLPPQGTA